MVWNLSFDLSQVYEASNLQQLTINQQIASFKYWYDTKTTRKIVMQILANQPKIYTEYTCLYGDSIRGQLIATCQPPAL